MKESCRGKIKRMVSHDTLRWDLAQQQEIYEISVSIPQKSTGKNESYYLLEVLPMMMPCGDLKTS